MTLEQDGKELNFIEGIYTLVTKRIRKVLVVVRGKAKVVLFYVS